MAFAPAVGLIIAALWLRYPGKGLSPSTADEYLQAFHERRDLGVRAMLTRMVAAVATLGSGAALGLEGPSIYMGATIGSALQRRWRSLLVGADSNVLLVAGAAAGIAAIFKAPATGAIFAIEVPFQEELARRMLLPALVAAASGYLALVAINGTAPLFPVHGAPPFSFVDLAGAAVLGLAAGGGARLFAADAAPGEAHGDARAPRGARGRVRSFDRRLVRDRSWADRPVAGAHAGIRRDHVGTRARPFGRVAARGTRVCAVSRRARRSRAVASAVCSYRSWLRVRCSVARSVSRSAVPIRCFS